MGLSESQSEKIVLECESVSPQKRLSTNTLGDLIKKCFNLEENEFSYQKIRTENCFDLSVKSYFQERKIFSEREIVVLIKSYYEKQKYNSMESVHNMIFTKKYSNNVKIELTKSTHRGKNITDLYDLYNIKVREETPLS